MQVWGILAAAATAATQSVNRNQPAISKEFTHQDLAHTVMYPQY